MKVKLMPLILFTLLAASSGFSPDSELQPKPYQSEVAGMVTDYLALYHYQKYAVDDTIAQRMLDEYLSSLDFNKMFFLKSDIEAFNANLKAMDDDLRANPAKLDKAFSIFNRYKQRVFERVDHINKLLADNAFDYTVDESYYYDREEQPWATSKDELDELWRKRIKEDLIRFKLRDKPEDEALDLLKTRYERVRKSLEDYEAADVTEMFLSSLAGSFDPHSTYLKPETKENFDIQMGHSLEGIGATLRSEGEYTVIVDLVKGGPADRSGQVHVNDKIIAVAQGEDDYEDVVDLRLDKVVQKIRGKKGTKVRLTMIPADAVDPSETKEVSIIRDRVQLTSLDAKYEIKAVKGAEGHAFRVGVINIPSFYLDSRARYRGDRNYKSTTRDVRKILQELEDQKVDGVVVDLRQNGGGSLDEAIRLTGLFVDYGPIVQIKDFKGKVRVESDPDPRQIYEGPLVVLTSMLSASASEIFASAIQDYERGVVVGGQSTHGKGTVQNIVPLNEELARRLGNEASDKGGALKLTTHKFYRISGGSTQFKGVIPDVQLPSPMDGLDLTEGALDYALPWDEIEPASHKNYGLVNDALTMLKTKSAKRVAAHPEFGYLQEDLAKREQEQADKSVSLNLKTRLAEKAALEARGEARKEERESRAKVVVDETPVAVTGEDVEPDADSDEQGDSADESPDFILEESLLIARDYIIFLKGDYVAEATAPAKKDTL